jgi:hypothetical protein
MPPSAALGPAAWSDHALAKRTWLITGFAKQDGVALTKPTEIG